MANKPVVDAAFIERMEKEILANQHKGAWQDWKPRPLRAWIELIYHGLKLAIALVRRRQDYISEFSADCANAAMKISSLYGETGVHDE